MIDFVYLPILITAEGVTFRTFLADDIIDVVLTRRGYGLDEGCMSVSLFQFVLNDRSTIDVVPGCLWFLYNDLRYQKEYKSIVDIVERFTSGSKGRKCQLIRSVGCGGLKFLKLINGYEMGEVHEKEPNMSHEAFEALPECGVFGHLIAALLTVNLWTLDRTFVILPKLFEVGLGNSEVVSQMSHEDVFDALIEAGYVRGEKLLGILVPRVMAVSKEFVNRKLSASLYELEREKNFQQIKNGLVELPGVGPHVIESYFAMRGLNP